jgi:cell wall-associated NlpC family hydrolase
MAIDVDVTSEPLHVGTVADALVVASIAPMLAEPHVSSGQVTQQLAGHCVAIVEDRVDWLLVRGADEYEGWMHRGYLAKGAPPVPDAARRISLGCVVRDPDDRRRALPLRAILGPRECIEDGDAIRLADVSARFPTNADAIVRSAMDFFVGTSYQWGGVTPWGADCSGLVQSIFALHGVPLPRDAWQQAHAGNAAGRDLRAARTADLLFFSDRPDAHVTHVAIATGDGRMVHLALGRGGYAVERLDDTHDDYVAKLKARFLFARRIL